MIQLGGGVQLMGVGYSESCTLASFKFVEYVSVEPLLEMKEYKGVHSSLSVHFCCSRR